MPGWGTYYVPHMFVNWCKHVFCTWHKPAPKIRICRYVCTRDTKDTRPRTGSGSDTRTARQSLHSEVRLTTTASVTEGVAAVSWISIESLMIRRPFGSIDPNSIRETELHTECRRRRERESLHSPQHATSITLLLLLKLQEQKTIKSSTEKQGSAFIVHKPNRTATST